MVKYHADFGVILIPCPALLGNARKSLILPQVENEA